MAQVGKHGWLHRIGLVDTPFDGHQQAQAYRFRRSEDNTGTPVERMLEPVWNTGGYANTALHRIAVTVGTLPG